MSGLMPGNLRAKRPPWNYTDLARGTLVLVVVVLVLAMLIRASAPPPG
jgi:hypothetical protein